MFVPDPAELALPCRRLAACCLDAAFLGAGWTQAVVGLSSCVNPAVLGRLKLWWGAAWMLRSFSVGWTETQAVVGLTGLGQSLGPAF